MTTAPLSAEEKRIADDNLEQRVTEWVARCQHDNMIPAILIGFGSDKNPDDVTVITPPEYPLRFLQLLLQGALEKVTEEAAKERPSLCRIVQA